MCYADLTEREQEEVVLVLLEERAPVAVHLVRVEAPDRGAKTDGVESDAEQEGVRLDDATDDACHVLELAVRLERVGDDDLVTDVEGVVRGVDVRVFRGHPGEHRRDDRGRDARGGGAEERGRQGGTGGGLGGLPCVLGLPDHIGDVRVHELHALEVSLNELVLDHEAQGDSMRREQLLLLRVAHDRRGGVREREDLAAVAVDTEVELILAVECGGALQQLDGKEHLLAVGVGLRVREGLSDVWRGVYAFAEHRAPASGAPEADGGDEGRAGLGGAVVDGAARVDVVVFGEDLLHSVVRPVHHSRDLLDLVVAEVCDLLHEVLRVRQVVWVLVFETLGKGKVELAAELGLVLVRCRGADVPVEKHGFRAAAEHRHRGVHRTERVVLGGDVFFVDCDDLFLVRELGRRVVGVPALAVPVLWGRGEVFGVEAQSVRAFAVAGEGCAVHCAGHAGCTQRVGCLVVGLESMIRPAREQNWGFFFFFFPSPGKKSK